MIITSDSIDWDDLVRMAKQVKDGPPVQMTSRAVLQIAGHIEAQCAEIADKQRIIDAQARMISDIQEKRRAESEDLSNLLAVIHRDGGHYQMQHGRAKAVEDAMAKVPNEYLAAVDELRELRMQMLSDEGQHIEETGKLRDALADLIDSAHRAAFISPIQMPHRHDDLVATIAKSRAILRMPDNTPGDGDKTMGDA